MQGKSRNRLVGDSEVRCQPISINRGTQTKCPIGILLPDETSNYQSNLVDDYLIWLAVKVRSQVPCLAGLAAGCHSLLHF